MSDRVTPRRMMPERWSLLEPLVDAALDLAPHRRPAFYDEVGASDPELRAELERLVGQSGNDDDLFRTSAAERFANLLDGTRAPSLQTEVLPQLQESLGAAYTIERELGGGGMARVFLAHEAELGRRVVIKVLTPELAAGMNAERFEREIKLAASLQQANIVPLLVTGRAAGYPYYTMPFVEGRSLRDRLAREGVLPIGEAVNLLRDVARALAYAHAQGVVHRDIKPGNVLLSGGTAVVTDFGIAKAISVAKSGADHPEDPAHLTNLAADATANTGSGIGTPPYMAPEQATGAATLDHRADIYAFGCLAYEVFTGKPPFPGVAPHLIIAAHLRETPRPVTDGRSDVPPAIATLIARCLEKDPRRRPQSAVELLDKLDSASSGPGVRTVRRHWPVAMVRAAVVGLAVVVGVGAYLVYPREPITLTAIPFSNRSPDSSLVYRADGISEDILTFLGKVRGIRIVNRNAARDYRGRNIDERVVQRELGAVSLITGTYQEREGSISVRVFLNDSSRGELFAHTFPSAAGGYRALTNQIARALADTLRGLYPRRRVGKSKQAPSAWTTNAAAEDNYLRGQFLLKSRGGHIPESVERFETAIRLDPSFADAHAALATALTFYPFRGIAPTEVKDSILREATRALDLDNTLADAHGAKAMIYAVTGEWERAVSEFKTATGLEPDNSDLHFNYGRILTNRGDLPEALKQLKEARRLEPGSSLVAGWSSYAYFLNNQASSALEELVRGVQLDSLDSGPLPHPVPHPLLTLVLVGTGNVDRARQMVAVQWQGKGAMTTAPYVYAKLNDTASAMRFVRQMESRTPRPWSIDAQKAFVMLGRGDSAGALSALEKSDSATGPLWAFIISPRDPAFDLVRQSPRFRALVARAGLDVPRVTAPRR